MKDRRRARKTTAGDLFALLTEQWTATVDGRTSQATYDAALRRWTSRTPAARIGETVLDAKGRAVTSRFGDLYPTEVTRDARGRVTTVSRGAGQADARVSQVEWDETTGFVSRVIDPIGRATEYERDAVGRVTQVLLPDGRTASFDYDANGNVTGISPPGRPAYAYTWDAVDLGTVELPPVVAGVSNPETVTEYDADRRVTRVTLPTGEVIEPAWNPPLESGGQVGSAGRLASLSSPRGVHTMAYSGTTGQLTSVSDPDGGTLAYAWDGDLPLGEVYLSGVSSVPSWSVAWAYDTSFRVVSETVSGSPAVSFGYDADSLLTSAGKASYVRRAATGQLAEVRVSDGGGGQVTLTQVYDGHGEVVQRTWTGPGGVALLDEALTRDGVGRITTKTEQWLGVQESRSYAYDVSGRLVRVDAEGDVLRRYGWDANSNRHDLLADGTPDPAKAATYDAQDRVLTWGEWSFDYDAKGSTTARTNTTTGAVRRTTYDVFGNLQHVELEDGTEVSYRVDARNRRVARQVNGATTHGWAYGDQLEPVAEYDGAGNLVARYVYGSRGHVPDYVEKDGQTYAYVTDHLGSVRMVVNVSTGDVAQRLRYDEWGRVEEDTNPGFQPFGYAGGMQDALTGLVRFGARDYDPEIGRWTTKDPIGFDGGMNWYGYVGGDPVNWVDVTGTIDIDPRIANKYPNAAREIRAGLDGLANPSTASDYLKLLVMLTITKASLSDVMGGLRVGGGPMLVEYAIPGTGGCAYDNGTFDYRQPDYIFLDSHVLRGFESGLVSVDELRSTAEHEYVHWLLFQKSGFPNLADPSAPGGFREAGVEYEDICYGGNQLASVCLP